MCIEAPPLGLEVVWFLYRDPGSNLDFLFYLWGVLLHNSTLLTPALATYIPNTLS